MQHTSFANFTRAIFAATGLAASIASAGGTAEKVLIIINPASAESMYLGHYYQFARGVPQSNVVYFDPAGTTFSSFAAANGNIDALLGKLNNSGLSKTIDYIVLASPQSFFVSAPGLVSDGCFPVSRFSLTTAFASAYMRNPILTGTFTSQETNKFYGTTPISFSSAQPYFQGVPNSTPGSRRYFICATLGYTGSLGNTAGDITAMIDRAVAADGTHPAGKFYFMNTSDPVRTPPRSQGFFPAVDAITAAGGQAEVINGVLPDFRNDCLGILTGWPDPNVDTAVFSILPGAFCDNLTSYAATFDEPAQTKMSAWIRRGAIGTSGTVEEPCNYAGKFTAPNLHVNYFKGMSLGEAWFRSMAYHPFQTLFQGDPIARPFSTLPTVSGNVPSGTIGTPVIFTPAASTTLAGAAIQSIELYIDGVLQSSKPPGSAFSINPSALSDGPHEARVLAYDNTAIRNVGHWIGTFNSSVFGRAVSLNMPTTTGTMTTAFTGNVSITGPGAVQEVRLIQNGRVLAAANTLPSALTVFGRNIGPGKTKIQAEVLYADGLRALSQNVLVDVAFTAGTISGQAPIAHSYRKRIQRGSAAVIELPATFDDSLTNATFTLLSNPAQATIGAANTKGYRVITAGANACGPDPITFRVDTPSGQSNIATVTLIYTAGPGCPADFDGSGSLTANDFQAFINGYAASSLKNDINGDCNLNAADFQAFLDAFAVGCP